MKPPKNILVLVLVTLITVPWPRIACGEGDDTNQNINQNNLTSTQETHVTVCNDNYATVNNDFVVEGDEIKVIESAPFAELPTSGSPAGLIKARETFWKYVENDLPPDGLIQTAWGFDNKGQVSETGDRKIYTMPHHPKYLKMLVLRRSAYAYIKLGDDDFKDHMRKWHFSWRGEWARWLTNADSFNEVNQKVAEAVAELGAPDGTVVVYMPAVSAQVHTETFGLSANFLKGFDSSSTAGGLSIGPREDMQASRVTFIVAIFVPIDKG